MTFFLQAKKKEIFWRCWSCFLCNYNEWHWSFQALEQKHYKSIINTYTKNVSIWQTRYWLIIFLSNKLIHWVSEMKWRTGSVWIMNKWFRLVMWTGSIDSKEKLRLKWTICSQSDMNVPWLATAMNNTQSKTWNIVYDCYFDTVIVLLLCCNSPSFYLLYIEKSRQEHLRVDKWLITEVLKLLFLQMTNSDWKRMASLLLQMAVSVNATKALLSFLKVYQTSRQSELVSRMCSVITIQVEILHPWSPKWFHLLKEPFLAGIFYWLEI